jgi:hypothetical protein
MPQSRLPPILPPILRLAHRAVGALCLLWPIAALGQPSSTAEPSTAEPSTAEPSTAEPSTAEPSTAEPSTAESIAVDFRYGAPASCPTREEAVAWVKRRTRRLALAEVDVSELTLDMAVIEEPPGFRGTMSVQRKGGAKESRVISGIHCDEVVKALALTAALSIDPNLALTLSPDLEDEPEKPQAPERATPLPEKNPPSIQTVTNHEKFRLSLGALVALNWFMNPGPHIGAGLMLTHSRLSSQVWFPWEIRVTLQVFAPLTKQEEPKVTTRMFSSRLAYCPLRLGGKFAALLCPHVDLGALVARAQGFEDSDPATRLYVALGLELWLRARLARHWELALLPGLSYTLTQREFGVEPGPQLLARTRTWAPNLALGLSWAF